MRKDISFFSKPKLKRELELIPINSNLLIDLTKAEFIDQDIVDTINEFMHHANQKNISVNINKSTYNESHKLIEFSKEIGKDDDTAH